MKKLLGLLFLLVVSLATMNFNPETLQNDHSAASVWLMPELDYLPSFPGAEGYGAKTRGGRGGSIFIVRNLNDSGEGSLRAAVEAEGPRTVVFRVSGTIELESDLRIQNPFITIAGQTAPGDGITIKGYLGINADDVIIRYIRVRTDGRGRDGDAINGRYNNNIIIDHVSASWGTDEVLSLYHNRCVTIQNTIISEAVGDGEGHKFGGIWGNNYGTYHHNLIAHNDSRNPRFASGAGHVDFRNNVIYNWGYNSAYGGEAHQRNDRRNPPVEFSLINMVANYYKPGPATRSNVRSRFVGPSSRDGAADLGQWYIAGNFVDGSPRVTADNWLGVEPSRPDVIENLRLGSEFRLTEPWPAMPIVQESAEEAYKTVLDHVGASLRRDPVDARIIEEVRTGTATYGNGIISSPQDVGGWPELMSLPAPVDSDGDGMPDWWEIKYGLDPKDPSDANGDLNGSGYTNIEEYLNGTDPTVFVDYTKPENNVNTLTADSFKPKYMNYENRPATPEKPRVIVTTDGEIDDRCSMVRFLLYANEWDIEGIILSSSQYHWQGRHSWAGDDWVEPFLDAYEKVHLNLLKHDPNFPTAEFLRSRTFPGNVKAEGEMEEVTPGSQRIVEVLLDDSDQRPIWIQAWGGSNTIARALKTIEEEYPGRMEEVAKKIRLFLIWEQDNTYQTYIRPNWGRFGIPTIISDQFIAIAYDHQRRMIPGEMESYFSAEWMNQNILKDRGPLLDLYEAHDDGRFRSEGDSPAFLHIIPNGLRSAESPGWGGWGGRFVRVRDNTWLDPVLEPGYEYPEGRWYTRSAWGRERLRKEIPNDKELAEYLKPQWRWIDAIQKDFAARADWCVKPYVEANHPPVVKLANPLEMKVSPGQKLSLSAKGTTDPDGDALNFQWWHYREASKYPCPGIVKIEHAGKMDASMVIPINAKPGQTIHVICEVTDDGIPVLTRYARVVMTVTR